MKLFIICVVLASIFWALDEFNKKPKLPNFHLSQKKMKSLPKHSQVRFFPLSRKAGKK